MMYNKWWKEKGGAGKCDVDEKGKKDTNALTIANVGGVFVVLFAGLILSIIVAILEFLYCANKKSTTSKISQQVSCFLFRINNVWFRS